MSCRQPITTNASPVSEDSPIGSFRMRRILAGFFAFGIANLILVLTLYRPVSQLEGSGEAFLHPVFGFAVYVGLMVWLFDWTARKMESAWYAALALGGAQFLLVNVDTPLRGDRAFETAAVSTLVMTVSWAALAAVWQWIANKETG